MSAIIKNFQIKLSEKQANEIRRAFGKACKDAGVSSAGMLIQPKTQWLGLGSVDLAPPVLDCAVISNELQSAVAGVIASHRPKAAVDNPEAL